jgi:hypothetical protein
MIHQRDGHWFLWAFSDQLATGRSWGVAVYIINTFGPRRVDAADPVSSFASLTDSLLCRGPRRHYTLFSLPFQIYIYIYNVVDKRVGQTSGSATFLNIMNKMFN